jgi:hypothetical protein
MGIGEEEAAAQPGGVALGTGRAERHLGWGDQIAARFACGQVTFTASVKIGVIEKK